MKAKIGVIMIVVFAVAQVHAAPQSCRGNKTQRHAEIAKRYAIDETYSLLTKCGLGDLLNFGLGDLGINLETPDMCNKPIDYLASIPAKEAVRGVNRAVNKGVRRPINKTIGDARRTVKTGSWYKDSEIY